MLNENESLLQEWSSKTKGNCISQRIGRKVDKINIFFLLLCLLSVKHMIGEVVSGNYSF